MLWQSCAYVLSCKWSGLSIDSSESMPRLKNNFWMKENEKIYFSKNDTPSQLKIVSIFTTFGNFIGIVFDSKNFLASNGIGYASKTSLSIHLFATKHFRVSKVTSIFLSRYTKSKMQFLHILISRWWLQNLPICSILVNFLTSSASRKFSMRKKHTC